VASGQLALHADRAEIGSLVVAVAHRRKGIGTALVRALVERAREQGVREIEISARLAAPWIRAWYERIGFAYQREHDFPDERVAILAMDLTPGAHL
jgi:ribosomal protein S18 acetylase RimI-like enzyme